MTGPPELKRAQALGVDAAALPSKHVGRVTHPGEFAVQLRDALASDARDRDVDGPCGHHGGWVGAHPDVSGVILTQGQALRLGVDIVGRLLDDQP